MPSNVVPLSKTGQLRSLNLASHIFFILHLSFLSVSLSLLPSFISPFSLSLDPLSFLFLPSAKKTAMWFYLSFVHRLLYCKTCTDVLRRDSPLNEFFTFSLINKFVAVDRSHFVHFVPRDHISSEIEKIFRHSNAHVMRSSHKVISCVDAVERYEVTCQTYLTH